MKKIIALHLENLKNAQHFNFMDFTKAAITQYGIADGKYAKFATKFLAAFEVPRTMPEANFRFVEVPEGVALHTVAWYNQLDNPVLWYDLPAGMTIPEDPEPPEGYEWHPYPDVMPEHDLDIVSEPIRG